MSLCAAAVSVLIFAAGICHVHPVRCASPTCGSISGPRWVPVQLRRLGFGQSFGGRYVIEGGSNSVNTHTRLIGPAEAHGLWLEFRPAAGFALTPRTASARPSNLPQSQIAPPVSMPVLCVADRAGATSRGFHHQRVGSMTKKAHGARDRHGYRHPRQRPDQGRLQGAGGMRCGTTRLSIRDGAWPSAGKPCWSTCTSACPRPDMVDKAQVLAMLPYGKRHRDRGRGWPR